MPFCIGCDFRYYYSYGNHRIASGREGEEPFLDFLYDDLLSFQNKYISYLGFAQLLSGGFL